MIETIFDTLNAKAAIFAVNQLFENETPRMPVMISGTITDLSGRTLSGQTHEAFWTSVAHTPEIISVGFNCALGARHIRPFLAELAGCAGVPISVYPNAGLPNAFGEYDESPSFFADQLKEMMQAGLINIVGGCCGTTPEHIAALSAAAAENNTRKFKTPKRTLRLSGLEPFAVNEFTNFVNVGERCNITGSKKFANLIKGKQYDEALVVKEKVTEFLTIQYLIIQF